MPCAGPQHGMHVSESASELVSNCVQRAQDAAASGMLLRLPFETLFQYLQVCACLHWACRPMPWLEDSSHG